MYDKSDFLVIIRGTGSIWIVIDFKTEYLRMKNGQLLRHLASLYKVNEIETTNSTTVDYWRYRLRER